MVRSAFEICLHCKERVDIKIQVLGWWRPCCKHWNGNKSTPDNPYGANSTCPYILEHQVLDDRRKFKLSNGEMFLPLLDYCDTNDIVCKVIGKTTLKNCELVIVDKKWRAYIERRGGDISKKDVAKWVNEALRWQGVNTLSHVKKYDEIVRSNGKWGFVQKEERRLGNVLSEKEN